MYSEFSILYFASNSNYPKYIFSVRFVEFQCVFCILCPVECIHKAFLSLCIPLKKDLKFTEIEFSEIDYRKWMYFEVNFKNTSYCDSLPLKTDLCMNSCSKYRKWYFWVIYERKYTVIPSSINKSEDYSTAKMSMSINYAGCA